MIVDRLVQYAETKGIALSTFEKELGFGNTTISRAYKSGTAIGSDKIEKILSVCTDLSPLWLVSGKGPMFLADEQPEPQTNSLPLIPIEAIAGPGNPSYDDLKVEDFYTVSEFKNSDFLLRVKGDSMTPKYTGGDLVACKRITDVLFFQWGRVYVLYTQSQGVMIKRVQPSEDKDCIRCVSDNEKYAPFDVPKSDIVALALVNGSISTE